MLEGLEENVNVGDKIFLNKILLVIESICLKNIWVIDLGSFAKVFDIDVVDRLIEVDGFNIDCFLGGNLL